MRIESIPRNADLLIRLEPWVSTEQFERVKHDFARQFPGQRAIFFRGDTVEITPIVRRRATKYTPSLVGHVK